MISALVNHLWQSTLFACAAGLLTLTLKRNGAAVRYNLWLAASIKFLVPFSLFVGLGSHIEWHTAPAAAQTRYVVVEQISDSISSLPRLMVPIEATSQIPALLFSIWLFGFAASILAWWRKWRQVCAQVRAGSPPRQLTYNVPVVFGAARTEPGVFGFFRPVILLPLGIRDRVTPTQLEAILEHELCHIRRYDNLLLALHMVVEALFWFHPLVWWIEARLVEERERACDEAVLRTGADPQDYAEGILAICAMSMESRLACVAGVTGSNLKERVERIMTDCAADELGLVRKFVLCAAAALTVTGPLLVGVIHAPYLQAQGQAHGQAQGQGQPVSQILMTATLPQFEAASVKPSGRDAKLKVVFAPGGKLFISNATLRFLIKIAYDIGDDQLVGGPGWISSKRFDLSAIPEMALGGDPQNMSPEQLILFHKPVRLRLQRLLADRFQLELRRESSSMPVFALLVTKGGPKKLTVTRSSGDPQVKAGDGILTAVGTDMTTLAKFLSEGQTGRPVLDMTGLKDKYDFRLEWTPDPGFNPASANSTGSPAPGDAGGISIFTALQQQLGLRLEARTDAADRFVVVGAEPASAN